MKFISKKTNLLITMMVALTGSQLCADNLKNDIEKESYSIGASTGKYVGNQIVRQSQLGLKVDIDKVVDGFVDSLQGKSQLKEEDLIKYLNARAEKLNEAKKDKIKKLQADNKKKEADYLAKNKKRDGVIVTKSGLQYEIIKKGKGANTKPESIAAVKYKASLTDGYVFEDSTKAKKPINLSMINIIDGLKEGLMLMNAGSKYKFYIPSELGYKDVQMRDIQPNSTLIFEVELEKILRPGDLRPKEKFELMGEQMRTTSTTNQK